MSTDIIKIKIPMELKAGTECDVDAEDAEQE